MTSGAESLRMAPGVRPSNGPVIPFTEPRSKEGKTMNSGLRLRTLVFSIAAFLPLGGCTCNTYSGPPPNEVTYENEPPPPPAPVAEQEGPSPGPEYVWIGGYHRWDGHAYIWVHGHYDRRPHPRANWVPAHWEARGRAHVFVDGHWG
jgi:hypothetical protein